MSKEHNSEKAWSAQILSLSASAQTILSSVGMAGLNNSQLGAMVMVLRAGLVEKFMCDMSEVERQGRPLFPLMLIGCSGGKPCRLELKGFLPGGETLRMAAFLDGPQPLWEDLVDLSEMGAPGWLEDGEDDWPPLPMTKQCLQACTELDGVDPEQVGAAFLPLRQGAPVLGIDAMLLMCAALDVRSKILKMSVGSLHMHMDKAFTGRQSYENISGWAWAGEHPLPLLVKGVGETMNPEDISKPGRRLESIYLAMEAMAGEMKPTEVRFTGRVIH